jgi:hypothetical protein
MNMSILNRPGWANRSIINEGRLHSDDLKQRITNLFQRTSLGNSPTYTVGKIADLLRREKGNDVDINDITDEDIIRIAGNPEVTSNKFNPKLKDSIASSRQETPNSTSQTSSNEVETNLDSDESIEDIEDFDIPSNDSSYDDYSSNDSELSDDSEPELAAVGSNTSAISPEGEMEFEVSIPSEDAEEKNKKSSCACNKEQRPQDEPKMNQIIKKESVKLSPKQVNKLLQENYIKSKQHKFRIEEKYGF